MENIKPTNFAKTCADVLGLKGRLLLFLAGFLGLFFPGTVAYALLMGIAKGLKDTDIKKMLEELE